MGLPCGVASTFRGLENGLGLEGGGRGFVPAGRGMIVAALTCAVGSDTPEGGGCHQG